MNNINQTFSTDDLTFVATCVLLGKATIEKVTFHPQKIGVKVFHLYPGKEVEKLYRLYVSDQLRVSPQQLNSKISAIRFLPVEKGKGNQI